MAEGWDQTGRRGRAGRRPVLPPQTLQYTLAVLGYIALIDLTKDYLTFTWGIFYFVMVLEVLPRLVRRARGLGNGRGTAAKVEVAES